VDFLGPLRRKKPLRIQADTGFLQKQQVKAMFCCLFSAFSGLFSSKSIEAF